MATGGPEVAEERRFVAARVVWAVLLFTSAALLSPLLDPAPRETVSAVGLLVAGLAATASGLWRAVREVGRAARAWVLLSLAGLIVLSGNLWALVSGADPLQAPSVLSDLSIVGAFVAFFAGLLVFPRPRLRGRQLTLMVLDGLVAGSSLLLVAAILIYPPLLAAPPRGSGTTQFLTLSFPVLDVLLATFALLLVLGTHRFDRVLLGLVAAGFLLYAASDIAFAVRVAEGDFRFGTLYDLGWIAGYLCLGLAAWVPRARRTPATTSTRRPGEGRLSDTWATSLVFGVVVVAVVVQVRFGEQGSLQQDAQSLLWTVIIGAAAARQILLVQDNTALRRDLERRVDDQTADLRRLARDNQVLVTSVADGIYGVDRVGRITFVNPSGAAALGYRAADLEGRHAHQAFHALDADGTAFPWEGCYIHDAIVSGHLVRGEADEYVRADSTTFPVEITASPVLDDGDILGAVVVFRDITERRQVDRMKDEFLSLVSHELRTPLTSIRGSLGLVVGGGTGPLPEQAGRLLGVAVDSTERLVRLINDLLDVERIGAGTPHLRLSRVDAVEVLRAAAHQIEGLATAAGVRVVVAPDAAGRLLVDEDRVMQTLMNLLGNALKFAPSGSEVTLASRPAGDRVSLSVTDHGRGIPADQLETIFERFRQVDSSDARVQGGTGLGLTISRAIVEQLGGRIWIESEVGAGTVVHITLPSADAAAADHAPDAVR